MSERTPVNPGRVEWSGENPGIYLRDTPDGDWVTLGIFFRIVLSPHGRGQTMIVLDEPDESKGYPEATNICLTDNEALTQYLVREFMSKFPSFRGRAGLDAMTWMPLNAVCTAGDMKSNYSETASASGLEVIMTWEGLDEPFAAEVGREHSATGQHEMYSVFFEAQDATISVNGVRLAGQVTNRQFLGRTMSTAFVAVSETWVTPVS